MDFGVILAAKSASGETTFYRIEDGEKTQIVDPAKIQKINEKLNLPRERPQLIVQGSPPTTIFRQPSRRQAKKDKYNVRGKK